MNFVRSNVTYEVSIEDRKYQITIPDGAAIGEAYDVIYKFLVMLSENAKMATERAKRIEDDKKAE